MTTRVLEAPLRPGQAALLDLQILTDVIIDARGASIKDKTLHSVVELCALRVYSILEEFLQRLFYQTMLAEETEGNGKPKFQVATQDELELLLFNTGSRREKYLDWLPYDVTLGRAEAYLVGGAPFSRLKYRPVELRAVAELAILRNAIAHPSDYAGRKFQELARLRSYTSDSPAEYLLSIRSGEPEVLHLVARSSTIVQGLTSTSDCDANNLMEPERPFEAEKKAPLGKFLCAGCGGEQELPEEGTVLAACTHCLVLNRCEACGRTTRVSPTWTRIFT